MPDIFDTDWFAVTELGADTWAIAEPGHVNSFLVVGSHTALLFDSGLGIADIGRVVTGLTKLPLLVVNSHSHYDHRGGNASLAARAVDLCAHRSGAELYSAATPEFLVQYRNVAAKWYEDFTRLQHADATSFYSLTAAMRMRPLPDLTDWKIPACRPTRLLDDGEVLDLGGRQLTVLHTPGHAGDSICLWEPVTQSLFCGDTVLAGTFWAHLGDADVAVFAATLRRLAQLPVQRALLGHNLRVRAGATHIDQVAKEFAAIAAGEPSVAPYPALDPFGNPVQRHDFREFAIFTPPSAVAPK